MASEPGFTSPLRVALAGAGRVGTAVACLLKERGHEIVGVWSRHPRSADHAAARLECATARSAATVAEGADLVLVGVVDDAIGAVASDLVDGLRSGAIVIHFAGALGIGVLEPVSAAGAAPAALHPVQSVPAVEAGIARLPGSAWGVTCEPGVEPWARVLIRDDLHGVPVTVAEDDRALWHAAAVMTSNGVAALLSTGASILAGIGIADPISVLSPLASGTVANVGVLGPEGAAFTGPVVRGDRATVESHLAALSARLPELLDEYVLVARAIVAGAARASRIDDASAGAMRQLLESA